MGAALSLKRAAHRGETNFRHILTLANSERERSGSVSTCVLDCCCRRAADADASADADNISGAADAISAAA